MFALSVFVIDVRSLFLPSRYLSLKSHLQKWFKRPFSGLVRWPNRQKHLATYLTTQVQSLGPTRWKERINSCKVTFTCVLLYVCTGTPTGRQNKYI